MDQLEALVEDVKAIARRWALARGRSVDLEEAQAQALLVLAEVLADPPPGVLRLVPWMEQLVPWRLTDWHRRAPGWSRHRKTVVAYHLSADETAGDEDEGRSVFPSCVEAGYERVECDLALEEMLERIDHPRARTVCRALYRGTTLAEAGREASAPASCGPARSKVLSKESAEQRAWQIRRDVARRLAGALEG